MALRGFYLNPGFGTLEHALGSQNKKPKANAVHTGRGESPSWVKYALTNTPINSIPTKIFFLNFIYEYFFKPPQKEISNFENLENF